MQLLVAFVGVLLTGFGFVASAFAETQSEQDKMAQLKQAALVGAELSTIAKHLQTRPQTAIDFTDISGEYCFETGLGKGAHMTHYAVDPTSTMEDIIDFLNAAPLIEAGINFDTLPRHAGTLGSMAPNQWYYLPAGEFEPHHGKEFPMPLLIRATNLE